MPLDTRDHDPYWARRMRMSSAEQEDLRRQAEAKAREDYHAETRRMARDGDSGLGAVGQAVDQFKAATQREFDKLLGRKAAPVQQKAADPRGGATSGGPAGALGRMVADGIGQTFPAKVRRQGTDADPGPGRLYDEWRSGSGPDRRVLEAGSSFSQEFAEAPSVRAHVRNAIDDWQKRDGVKGVYTDYKGEFGPSEFIGDLVAGNAASHTIGSFALDGTRRDGQVDWVARNRMGRHSFWGGRLIDDYVQPRSSFPIPHPADRAPGQPQGTKEQEIRFSTDLQGRPLLRR